MRAYFFSDVHLGLRSHAEEREKEDRLLSFLHAILPTAGALYIVGDLFDFWFEYATVIPKGFHRTLTALEEFTRRGIPVHFMAGNHDYWIGDFFEKELGLTLHMEPFETVIDGQRVFLHHGDGLAHNDLGYRLIKPVLRNRLNVVLYRWLHPDVGVRLARGSSRTSRDYTSQKHYGEGEGMREFARQKIAEGVNIVVMGHRHEPQAVAIDGGLYVNLGDWITHNTYGEMADGHMSLKAWQG